MSMTHKCSCIDTRRQVSIWRLTLRTAVGHLTKSTGLILHILHCWNAWRLTCPECNRACAGAEVMSLINDDENKTFGAVFRTPVDNSKGIPHILEHSVLCGSKNYPIKEPFVELMKGSLNTFLNAFTYPDRTCYPVASTNLQARPLPRLGAGCFGLACDSSQMCETWMTEG